MKQDDWYKRGACRGANPELFFRCAPRDVDKARDFCTACPVVAQCLQAAMSEEAVLGRSPEQNLKLRSGVRGGMTAMERWVMVYPEDAERYRQGRNARLREARRRAREEALAETGAAALGIG